MKKILEKDLSYYRLDLHTGNIIYFSHAANVKNEDYINLDIKDIIAKIDELVEAYNSIELIKTSLEEELIATKTQLTQIQSNLQALQAQGASVHKEESTP